MVQNKLHYAIHHHTAAEVILERADHKKEHMGMTTWKNAPAGKIVKADVSIAKNYLTKNYPKRNLYVIWRMKEILDPPDNFKGFL